MMRKLAEFIASRPMERTRISKIPTTERVAREKGQVKRSRGRRLPSKVSKTLNTWLACLSSH